MNWSTLVKVVRFHLADWLGYTLLLWATQAFSFAVNLAIFANVPATPGKAPYTGALVTIYIVFAIVGARSISRSLPFAFALGLSRRSYYAGTALLAVVLAAVNGLALTILSLIERATGGWGLSLHFFRVPYLLAGPWYLTWLTSFAGLALMFVYGMWFGLIYRRWNLAGVLTFTAAQVTVVVTALLIATRAHAWPGVGRFFTTLTITGLTGLLIALAIALLVGGYATMRRITV